MDEIRKSTDNRCSEYETLLFVKTNGNGCPYCSGQKVLSGFNDLQTRYPMIAAMWHPAKNGEIQSNMVAPYSTQKAWWIDWNGREVYRRIDSMVAMAKKRIYLE